MVVIFYKRIKAGLMTIDDVPRHWRDNVKKRLDADQKGEKE